MDGKYMKAVFRVFVISIVAALIFQSISLGIYWFNKKNFGESGKYREEKDRCDNVISGQESSTLIDYSYCKKYLKWFEKNQNIDKQI